MASCKRPIDFEIGFADASLISFHFSENDLVVEIELWNEKKCIIHFLECIFFKYLEGDFISEIFELSKEDQFLKNFLIENYLNENYSDHKIFQIFDVSGKPFIEVISKSLICKLA